MTELILLGGVVGTGKTTIAESLSRRAGFVHLDWDVIVPAEELLRRARSLLQQGQDVVISEWFHPSHGNVEKVRDAIRGIDVRVYFLRLTASLRICLSRKPDVAHHVSCNHALEQTASYPVPWKMMVNDGEKDPESIAEDILKMLRGQIRVP